MTTSTEKISDAAEMPECQEFIEQRNEDDLIKSIGQRCIAAAKRLQTLPKNSTNLPTILKNRIEKLKKLQIEYNRVDYKFNEELLDCVKRYSERIAELQTRRRNILNGTTVIDDDAKPRYEVKSFSIGTNAENEECLLQYMPHYKQIIENAKDVPAGIKGLPNFWLTVLRNCAVTSEMIATEDVDLLSYLTDLSIDADSEKRDFTFRFVFSKNEYFSNRELTKTYFMLNHFNEANALFYDTPDLYHCKGCIIDWYKGKDLTQRTTLQTDSQGNIFETTIDSFFDFFNVPDKFDTEEALNYLDMDLNIGCLLRTNVIPNAIEYYLGLVIDIKQKRDMEDNSAIESDASNNIVVVEIGPDLNSVNVNALIQKQKKVRMKGRSKRSSRKKKMQQENSKILKSKCH